MALDIQKDPAVSIVVPCYNEAQNILPLYERLKTALEKGGYPDFELIFVENGSSDRSEEIMSALHQKDSRVRVIQLSRNFSYQGAITAGMHYVSGKAVVTMDGDLQDPPEIVPSLLNKLKEGYELVYGVRTKRQEGFLIRACYKTFYLIWQKMSNIPVPRDAGDFCAMTQRVSAHVSAMPERNRFLRGLRVYVGFKQTGIPYERSARAAGESKFSLSNYFTLASEALIAFSSIPLRLLTLTGIVLFAIGLCISANLIVLRLLSYMGLSDPERIPRGFALNNALIVMFGASNLLGLGIIGEYVGRIYDETKRRPIFIVTKLLGVSKDKNQNP